LVCDKDVGSDVGAGRITGGHDGRPDDIRIVGDGIDSGGDGTSWCRNGKPVCDSGLCKRIIGGHDGRPDDIGIAGDGIDSDSDGIRWCWSGEPAG